MADATTLVALAAGATAYTALATGPMLVQVQGAAAAFIIIQVSATPPDNTATAYFVVDPGQPPLNIDASSGDTVFALASGIATSIVWAPITL